MLLLPRRHAHALLHEGALQIPAGGVSLRSAWSKRTGAADKRKPEFELLDTGVFDEDRYFDVFAEYAKAVARRHPDPDHRRQSRPGSGRLHVLPTLWFRNTWSWGCTHEGCEVKPRIAADGDGGVRREHATLGRFRFWPTPVPRDGPDVALHGERNEHRAALSAARQAARRYFKDAFHEYVVHGNRAR